MKTINEIEINKEWGIQVPDLRNSAIDQCKKWIEELQRHEITTKFRRYAGHIEIQLLIPLGEGLTEGDRMSATYLNGKINAFMERYNLKENDFTGD